MSGYLSSETEIFLSLYPSVKNLSVSPITHWPPTIFSKRVTIVPRLMRGGSGFTSDTRPSAFRGCTPVSRAGMRRLVPAASLSSFSPLGRAFAQFHARLSLGARDGYRYARGALSARARRTGLPFVRLVLPAPGFYHFVNICFLEKS